ncbi:MAG TPA: hypothetical protein VGQ69_09935 [Gemmatimonadales bacterium]|nr:hypothetical protein [Gemmatimonadales bacterium]
MSGCVAWRVESIPPREVLKNPDVHAVRVTSTDSAATKIEIYDPSLVGDSISGHPTKQAVARIYVPLSHVQAIATQHKSVGKTALLVLGVGGAVALYALLQSLNPPGY